MGMDVWNKIHEELTKSFDSSLNSAILDKIEFKEIQNNDSIVLLAPDPLTSGWFCDNYLDVAKRASQKLFHKEYKFIVEISQTDKSYKSITVRNTKKAAEKSGYSQLNPKYTFDRFIVGPNNDFAHAAAEQVANNPAKSYNPLFIYGNAALGKTHLLQSIAHKIIKEKNDLNVFYTTSENFTNEFVESIKNGETNKFRKKYRNFDVLLVDDIQFLQQKESTLEELFHTFNELFHERKQLIFACDRPAKSLSAIEDRLRTRFDSGLSVKIEPPNYETRKAILLSRTAEEKTYIPDEVVEYISQNVESDIRLLEGSLTKIIAFSSLKKKDVSLDLAKEILRDKIKMDVPKNVTISDIQRVVSKYFNISINDIKSEKRLENIAYARHVAMFLSKEYTNHSLTEIGTLFGGKAHTTVMRSADKVASLLKNRKKTKKEIEEIISDFYNTKKETVS
jgi:chromosomal replication initiator protein